MLVFNQKFNSSSIPILCKVREFSGETSPIKKVISQNLSILFPSMSQPVSTERRNLSQGYKANSRGQATYKSLFL